MMAVIRSVATLGSQKALGGSAVPIGDRMRQDMRQRSAYAGLKLQGNSTLPEFVNTATTSRRVGSFMQLPTHIHKWIDDLHKS